MLDDSCLSKIRDLLGGEEVISQVMGAESDLDDLVRMGLPCEAVRHLAKGVGVSLAVLQAIVGINRIRARGLRLKRHLSFDESYALIRVARIAALAVEAMGEEGIVWLHESNLALDLRKPFALLDTETGARRVEQIIGRIEHGIFS
jgi:putative toxin-antitoxin system antitoxin component (TIGR02293 family)